MGDNSIFSVFSNIWSSVRLKIPPSIPSFMVTKIVYIGYGQLKKWLLFLLPVHSCAPCRAHQIRRSGRNVRPISAEVALPRLQSEIKVALFLFASHSFLANNLRFMVKLIVKTIVINGKIHKNKRKRFYSSNKEGLICWYKSITANFCKFVLTKFQVNIKSQILKYTNRRFLYQIGRWIVLYFNYFHKTWVICSFLKAKQSTCLSFKHGKSWGRRKSGEGNEHLDVIDRFQGKNE